VLANGHVLLGLVTTLPSYAGDGTAESVLAVACCRRRVMSVMTLLSHVGDGAIEMCNIPCYGFSNLLH
jgi:hypothetical protein